MSFWFSFIAPVESRAKGRAACRTVPTLGTHDDVAPKTGRQNRHTYIYIYILCILLLFWGGALFGVVLKIKPKGETQFVRFVCYFKTDETQLTLG